jgi:sugar lactone lactonase YvrE
LCRDCAPSLGKISLVQCAFAAIIVTLAAIVGPRPAQAQAAGTVQVLATVGGQPDDITVDAGGHLVWGDLTAGTIDRLSGGRVAVVARGLSVPEGVIALANGTLIVAEQGLDRIDRIGPKGTRRVIYMLQPVAGQEGVDGIGRDPKTGDLLVPDSPRGTVVRVGAKGRHARVIARGLGRPVDAAIDRLGNVLVPDEHLGTLVVISPRGRVSYRGSFATPDDVAVTASGRVWVTSLGDGGLWELDPGAAPRRVLSGLGNPQGLTLDRCGDPIVVDQNSARIIRLRLTSDSSRCRL